MTQENHNHPAFASNDENTGDSHDRLASTVTRIEKELNGKRKKWNSDERNASFAESIYMLIFYACLLFFFGGVLGRMFDVRAATRSEVSDGFLFDRLRDLKSLGPAFMNQLEGNWHFEAALSIIVLIVIFGVKKEKKRRRYFSLVMFAFVAIFTVKLLHQLLPTIQ